MSTKTVADIDDIAADTQRMFVGTASRFPGKIRDLVEGRTPIDLQGVHEFVPIIVTYESAFVEPILREVAGQEAMRGIQLLGIADLETLSAWNAKHGMLRLLREWRDSYDQSPQECGTFLLNWSKSQSDDDVAWEHPLLKQTQDSFVGELASGIGLT
jgi:hypothetical protein